MENKKINEMVVELTNQELSNVDGGVLTDGVTQSRLSLSGGRGYMQVGQTDESQIAAAKLLLGANKDRISLSDLQQIVATIMPKAKVDLKL